MRKEKRRKEKGERKMIGKIKKARVEVRGRTNKKKRKEIFVGSVRCG